MQRLNNWDKSRTYTVASDPAVKGLVFVRRFLFCWDSVGGEGGTIMVQPEYCPHYMDSYLLRLVLSRGNISPLGWAELRQIRSNAN